MSEEREYVTKVAIAGGVVMRVDDDGEMVYVPYTDHVRHRIRHLIETGKVVVVDLEEISAMVKERDDND